MPLGAGTVKNFFARTGAWATRLVADAVGCTGRPRQVAKTDHDGEVSTETPTRAQVGRRRWAGAKRQRRAGLGVARSPERVHHTAPFLERLHRLVKHIPEGSNRPNGGQGRPSVAPGFPARRHATHQPNRSTLPPRLAQNKMTMG